MSSGDPISHECCALEVVIGEVVSTALVDLVDRLRAGGRLPISLSEVLDDIGQACQRAGERIMIERTRRGIPMPNGPDD